MRSGCCFGARKSKESTGFDEGARASYARETCAIPEYRPLDRKRNEIRLLRILPPSPENATDTLDFSTDTLRCEMEYHSMDDILQERDSRAVPASSSAGQGEPAVDPHSISRNRVALLSGLYLSQEEQFKRLIPNDDWDSDEEEGLFAYWMKSWIWTSLSNEYSDDGNDLRGYIALSYVWAEQPKVSDTLARQKKVYQIFQDISPTCAELMAKAIPTVTETPETALSRTEIILDGQRISIGTNLASAFRTLREIPDVQAGMLVWADALCINQNDLEERNTEVKRMDTIYKHAKRVISWLSEADRRHVEALEFMNVVGEYLGQLESVDVDVATAWFASFDLHMMVEYQAVLSELPYFYRAWIVQEIVLAAPLSHIICHNRRFYWKNILHFVYSFNKRRSESQSNSHLLQVYDRSDPTLGRKFLSFNAQVLCLHDAFALHRLGDNTAFSMTPTEAWFGSLYLRLASQANCKDARDRVYGFMSIYPGDIARFIQPEYAPEKTLAQVMGDLAIAHIKATSTLDWVLLATDIYPSVDPWPSWVPNIAIPYKDVTLSWVAGHQPQGKKKTAEISWGPLDASGVPSLRAKGFKLDVISDAGLNRNKHIDSLHPIAQGAVEINLLRYFLVQNMGAQVEHVLPEMELESFAWVQHAVASYFITNVKEQHISRPTVKLGIEHKYGDDRGLQSAVETCMKVVGWELKPGLKDVHTIFAAPMQETAIDPGLESGIGLGGWFAEFRKRNGYLDFWGRSLESFFATNKPQSISPVIDTILKPLPDMHRSSRGNLFTTAGGYIGANLCRLQSGDEVYLLFGCRMPVVLRKVGDGYQLVGSVYVCGVMDGNVMDQIEASGTIAEEVLIK